MKLAILLLFILIVVLSFRKSTFEQTDFPFRHMVDEKNNKIPIYALTSFLRSENDKKKFDELSSDPNKLVIGVTAYKTFPKPISDTTGDSPTLDDTFEYTKKIKDWLVCFKNPSDYTFTGSNHIIEMSESDFKDPDISSKKKKYDIIYSCLDDDNNSCAMDGWNAVNRNFDLALKCFPIMINEFNLKILVMGRTKCGLEKLYPGKIETLPFLPYNEFQEKLSESRYLFVPNIYDASPRVVTEAITKNIPVLMNRSIVCGSKYINEQTGELFTDEHDIRYHLKKLLGRKMEPVKWWKEHYGYSRSGVKLRNFLYETHPTLLKNIKEVHFF